MSSNPKKPVTRTLAAPAAKLGTIITSARDLAHSIAGAELIAGAVHGNTIATGAISSDRIITGTISTGKITAGSLPPSTPTHSPAPALTSVTTPPDLGRMVRQAREAMNLTQAEFADMAGVGRRFVSELENGKATLELGKVMAACAAAGIDLLAARR